MITIESSNAIGNGIPKEYICKYRKQCGGRSTCPHCKGYELDDVFLLESKQVYLGGTCGESTWREKAIADLQGITYFNPQLPVGAWNDDAYGNECVHMNIDDILLYVMTPEMVNYFSYAEVVDMAHRRRGDVYFTFLAEEHGKRFTDSQLDILDKIGYLVENAGGLYFDNFYDAIDAIRKHFGQTGLDEEYEY